MLFYLGFKTHQTRRIISPVPGSGSWGSAGCKRSPPSLDPVRRLRLSYGDFSYGPLPSSKESNREYGPLFWRCFKKRCYKGFIQSIDFGLSWVLKSRRLTQPPWFQLAKQALLASNSSLEATWEFPKIRGPNTNPQIVGMQLQGHPQKGPQFVETATHVFSPMAPWLHYAPASDPQDPHTRAATQILASRKCLRRDPFETQRQTHRGPYKSSSQNSRLNRSNMEPRHQRQEVGQVLVQEPVEPPLQVVSISPLLSIFLASQKEIHLAWGV